MTDIISVWIDEEIFYIPLSIMKILLPGMTIINPLIIDSNRYRWKMELNKYNGIHNRCISISFIDDYYEKKYLKQLSIILKYKFDNNSLRPGVLEYVLSKNDEYFNIFNCNSCHPDKLDKYMKKYKISHKDKKYPLIHEISRKVDMLKDFLK